MSELKEGFKLTGAFVLLAVVVLGVVMAYANAHAGPECPRCHGRTVMDRGLAECFQCKIRYALDMKGNIVDTR